MMHVCEGNLNKTHAHRATPHRHKLLLATKSSGAVSVLYGQGRVPVVLGNMAG